MSVLQQAGGEERVQQLVERCGEGARLVIDTLLPASELLKYHPAANVCDVIKAAACDSMDWIGNEPLWLALQSGRAVIASAADPSASSAAAECQLCAPTPLLLSVVHHGRSGSTAEGFHDIIFGHGGTSDYDIMFELAGAFRWTEEAVMDAGTEPSRISPQSAPQLWAESAGSPGFVMLRWARTSGCVHEAPLPALTPDSIRQLMSEVKRVGVPEVAEGVEITCSGPAVNVLLPHATDGGVDHVPCLRLPWWPDKRRFLARYRETEFRPAAAARRDICEYGVHLVPTGRPGSVNELAEWRVSFSRAEVVTAHHLSTQQRATVRAVKGLKVSLKESGAAPALKSYYIKTAVFWLVQDAPSDRWTSVTDAVHMVLDWLELHLTAGSLPCFFWDEVDLLSGLCTEKVEDMMMTVRMMRSRATHLLMAGCMVEVPMLEQSVLEVRSEPLSERQLRLCLARMLIRLAVTEGFLFRLTAPCWYYWGICFIPPLVRLSERRLLDWRHRRDSGACHQQCYLLQAMLVAPADLVAGVRLTSIGGDMFTWDVTPLLALLTDSDLQQLLGDWAAVATWCRQQLCRPLAEQPAGLTAELDTPQGRAEVLLQPELLLRALKEAVPAMEAWYLEFDQELVKLWKQEYMLAQSYRECREVFNVLVGSFKDMQLLLHVVLPEMDNQTVVATAYLWWWRTQYLLSGDRLRTKYDTAPARYPDRWQLRKFVLLETPTTGGSPQGDKHDAAGGEEWRRAEQEEEERYHVSAQEQCRSLLKGWRERMRNERLQQERREQQEQEERSIPA